MDGRNWSELLGKLFNTKPPNPISTIKQTALTKSRLQHCRCKIRGNKMQNSNLSIGNIFGKKVGTYKNLLAILLCCASVLALMPLTNLAHGQVSSTVVTGSVVDSSGFGLGNIVVELRTTSGALITSTSTSFDGAFTFADVDFGTYSLRLNKPGYIAESEAISVSTPVQQQLGAIVLFQALSLSTSTLGLAANPGDRIQIPVTTTYSGDSHESVAFSVSVPEGWTARILQGSYEITKISLSSGQSAPAQFEVNIPATATRGTTYNFSLTANGATSAYLNFTVLIVSQSSVTVSGRVVDENNNVLSGVSIDVSTSAGVSVKTVQASSDGSFSFDLQASTSYLLQFSKGGYTTVSMPLMLIGSNANSALGNVVLTRTIWLTSSIISIAVSPGDKLDLPFTVSNMGSDLEPVEFSASVPSGWHAKVLDGSYEVGTISLSPSGSSSLQLEVTVPLGANGTYKLSVSAAGNITTTLNFTAKVGPPSSSMLSCNYPGKSSAPGDTVKFQVKLKNPFGAEMRFNLSAESLPVNWTAIVKTSAGDFVSEFILGANEVSDFVVEVKSPAAAATDVAYTLSVKAEAIGQNLTDSLPLTATLTELANVITMTARLPEVAIQAGNHVDYSVTVSNLGAEDRTLILSAKVPTNWQIIFKLGTSEITRLLLYGGNTSELLVQVIPPNQVALGTYTFPVQVKSESGNVLAETNLTTTVTGSYALSLSPSVYQASANSGESTSFTVNVFNTGFTPVSGVMVNVTLPDQSWSSTVTPVQAVQLGPQESATFNVVVKTGENTVSGDYMVTAKGSSDQVSSDSSQVRVTVSTSTSWGIYGVAIAAVFIVALVLVFRKIKRR